jgi:hypothetical protein
MKHSGCFRSLPPPCWGWNRGFRSLGSLCALLCLLGLAACFPEFPLPQEAELKVNPIKVSYLVGDAINKVADLEVSMRRADGSWNRLGSGEFTLTLDGNPVTELPYPGELSIGVRSNSTNLTTSYTVLVETPPKTLIKVKPNGDATHATTTLTLEFDQPVDGLSKEDIILTAGSGYLLTNKKLEPVDGSPGVYLLTVDAVVTSGAVIVEAEVTVRPTGKKGDVELKGEEKVTVYFLPVMNYDKRMLIKAEADGSLTKASTQIRVEFDQPVEGLAVGDFSFVTGGGVLLLTTEGIAAVDGSPEAYILTIQAVYNDITETQITLHKITVQAGGTIAGGVVLAGEVKEVPVYFLPVMESSYQWFTLEQAVADGQSDIPVVPSSKVTLTLWAEKESQLPAKLSPEEISIELLTAGMTLTKGAVSGPASTMIMVNGEQKPGKIYELAVSQVNMTGRVRISIIKEGYLQINSPLVRELFGLAIEFRGAEEDPKADANDGTGTRVILEFSEAIPGGLAAKNIVVNPPSIAVTGVEPITVEPGKYRLGLSWGTVANWNHTPELSILVDNSVVSPTKRQVFLSMRNVDPIPSFSGGLALRRVPGGTFKRDSQSETISVLD